MICHCSLVYSFLCVLCFLRVLLRAMPIYQWPAIWLLMVIENHDMKLRNENSSPNQKLNYRYLGYESSFIPLQISGNSSYHDSLSMWCVYDSKYVLSHWKLVLLARNNTSTNYNFCYYNIAIHFTSRAPKLRSGLY